MGARITCGRTRVNPVAASRMFEVMEGRASR